MVGGQAQVIRFVLDQDLVRSSGAHRTSLVDVGLAAAVVVFV